MKLDRLIGILTALLQQEKTTAPRLARQFEVSRKTINRDIDTLCEAGIPIITTQGFNGGISLSEHFRLDAALLSEDEKITLLAGLQGMDSVSAHPANKTLHLKLGGNKTSDEEAPFIVDLASHYRQSLVQKVELLKTAIAERKLVTFTYHYEAGTTERTVEPYRIVYKWSTWYLFGFCRTREDFRIFRLNRIWDMHITESDFQARPILPEQWSFDGYFSQENFRLKALFSPLVRYRLVEEYGPDSYSEQADGRLAFEEGFASYENMKEWIFSFGAEVLVLEPKELKADVIAHAKKILEQYEEQDR